MLVINISGDKPTPVEFGLTEIYPNPICSITIVIFEFLNKVMTFLCVFSVFGLESTRLINASSDSS